jgi:hypothetical protein
MDLLSKFLVKTHVEIVLRGEGWERVIPLGENVITDLGRSNMAHLLAGDDVASRKVTQVKFGDGGHQPADPTQPIPPSSGDTDLFGVEIIAKTVSSDYPDGEAGTKVRFTATVGAEEGNGAGTQPYSEVGLYDITGRMLTHKTFGLITKSNSFSFAVNYVILF